MVKNVIVPLGPVDNFWVADDFMYEEVKESQCHAVVAKEVCNYLVNQAEQDNKIYMTVCLPCYNEDFEELLKTLISLMENFEFMKKKAKIHGDSAGKALREEFLKTEIVIVPIFDGTKALSPSMKDWLSSNFPNLLEGLEGESGPHRTDVRVGCMKWWYYCSDMSPEEDEEEEIQQSPDTKSPLHNPKNSNNNPTTNSTKSVVIRDEVLPTPTTTTTIDNNYYENDDDSDEEKEDPEKVAKYRKNDRNSNYRNSTDRMSFGRDSQIFDAHFISRLTGLSAGGSFSYNFSYSYRDENFNPQNLMYFYIVPIVKRSNHRKHNSHEWFFDSICEGLRKKITYAFLTDCGTTYQPTCVSRLLYELFFKKDLIGVTARQRVETPNNYFHPCEDSPFKWFSGDHSSGDQRPCWKCYATYFFSPCPLQGFEFEATLILNSAMFNLVEALPVMPGPCQLLNWKKMKKFKVVSEYFNLLFEEERNAQEIPKLPRRLKSMRSQYIASVDENDASSRRPMSTQSVNNNSNVPPHILAAAQVAKDEAQRKKQIKASKLTFTEFLRVNMRLAEDRILSFVSVFSTGHGTKWVPGATFYYQPEIRWETLLTQRRRWLNGTFASFLFFFLSSRAKTRISGGMFDAHKAGKNLRFLNALWSLQLYQLLLVLIAPSVFASSAYVGLIDCARKSDLLFGWALIDIFGPIRIAEIWIAAFLLLYFVWSVYSYYAPRGRMPEFICRWIAIIGFVYIFPVYFSVWYSVFTDGVDMISGLVIVSLLAPVFIALAESERSAFLYCLYLPWFLVLIIFFLVFIPSYSFSRLWDTTWGNRATGKDSAINDNLEQAMKSRNKLFIFYYTIFNIGFTWALVKLFGLGFSAIVTFMYVVFLPVVFQLVCSFVFLFIVLPMRTFAKREVPQESTLVDPHNTSDYSLGITKV